MLQHGKFRLGDFGIDHGPYPATAELAAGATRFPECLMSNLIRKVTRRIDRSIGMAIECVYLYRLQDRDAIPSLSPPPGLEILQLQPDQMSLLTEVLPSLEVPKLSQTQVQHSQCYAASLGGRVLHYSWVQTSGPHSILEAGRRVDVAPGEFWIYDCQTHPSARGLGIYPYMLTFIARDHLQRNLREGIIYTTVENIASQRGIQKAGFTLKETLRSLRIGRWYMAF